MKVRTDAKRDEILQMASQVFLELGFGRASMAQIAARIGGSKATLYGYFASKEALFLAIIHRLGEEYVSPALERLEESADEEPRVALQRFGEQFLGFVNTPEAIATYRVVVGEAAHSDIGRAFYESGPQRTIEAIARYLSGAMSRKQLRRTDASLAAQHLMALLTHGECWHHYFMRESASPTRTQIKRIVERALEVFFDGYAP
jgi:AcrR family transcriptional regulator